MSLHSLKFDGHTLADPKNQVGLLEGLEHTRDREKWDFDNVLSASGIYPLRPKNISTLQVNVGKVCNQACKHCHVDAAPDRKESMTFEVMEKCLEVAINNEIPVVDITGGAPEINMNFRWFVESLRSSGIHVIVRSNLTIINSADRFSDLPEFFRSNKVEVISSLPYFTRKRTDSQRGDGVFDSSITALKKLNAAGYGIEPELKLNLVYNPAGAYLAGDQNSLEVQFKKELHERHGVVFNQLFAITNLPVSRFLDYLVNSGNLEGYMEKLVSSYNQEAAGNVMCREMISVGWDGKLYDCDFNQMLECTVEVPGSRSIFDFDHEELMHREIATGMHCFGCTAGAGSSCGGATV